jgi:hypothetical protein
MEIRLFRVECEIGTPGSCRREKRKYIVLGIDESDAMERVRKSILDNTEVDDLTIYHLEGWRLANKDMVAV